MVGKLVLNLNMGLTVAGPALAGTAVLASVFVGSGEAWMWASDAAAFGGALAAAVNTVDGGQMGMLFELLRNCAGFYGKIQEDIEANLDEPILHASVFSSVSAHGFFYPSHGILIYGFVGGRKFAGPRHEIERRKWCLLVFVLLELAASETCGFSAGIILLHNIG